jgi:hypothetical protein
VLDGLGVREGRRIGRGPDTGLVGRREEDRLDPPVVGHVVGDPERDLLAGAPAEDDVERFGRAALDPGQLVDVRADLEDRARRDVAGELRVGDLEVPGAEEPVGRARLMVDTQEEVRVAAPGAVEERRLVDDVGAGRHRSDGLGRRLAQLASGAAVRGVDG